MRAAPDPDVARTRNRPARLPEPAMRENQIRALWREGRAAVNGWLAIPSSFAAFIVRINIDL